MAKKKNISSNPFLFLAVLIIGGFLLFYSTKPDSGGGQTTIVSGYGRTVFAVTDMAADIGNITAIKVTIGSVLIHNTANDSWINISITQETIDLLELKSKNINVILHDYQLPEGNYNQIRLDISKTVVTDWTGDKTAKLPSGMLKFNIDLEVKEGQTSSVLFDFIADRSLHITGNGKYIMAPVIKLTAAEEVSVETTSDEVKIKGGKLKTEIEVGTDEHGNVGPGIQIAADKKLSIQGDMIVPY